MSPGANRLHWYLSGLAKGRRCEASLQQLADRFGVTRRTLMRWVNELTKAGTLLGTYHHPPHGSWHRDEDWTWHLGRTAAECEALFMADFGSGR